MNSGRFPTSKKRLGKIRFTTHTPSLIPVRPKIRLARTEPTKPAGAGVVVRVLNHIYKRRARAIDDYESSMILDSGQTGHGGAPVLRWMGKVRLTYDGMMMRIPVQWIYRHADIVAETHVLGSSLCQPSDQHIRSRDVSIGDLSLPNLHFQRGLTDNPPQNFEFARRPTRPSSSLSSPPLFTEPKISVCPQVPIFLKNTSCRLKTKLLLIYVLCVTLILQP
ncbi:hypothetical protein AVEN_262300-1 [Araneus ventricosus]|uniref:Uncharacterized protein n=1 Tax=Araneus ventricosus TaxID=182803 RepID=A0A4Y2RAV4_ARAVE|nr:hypothetical protein AVEN_262300-1 [Araneus ventricosus]